jgi:hypothetical protein
MGGQDELGRGSAPFSVWDMTVRDLNAARSAGRRDEVDAEAARPEREPAVAPAGNTEIEIRLADLIGDEAGEIVLFNDSSARSLGVLTEDRVVGSGRADRHVTASGADVTGFRFIRFENGLTIYFEDGLGVIVRGADRAEAY